MTKISIKDVLDEAIKTPEGKEKLSKAIADLLAENKTFREGIANYLVMSWEIISKF